MAELRLCAQIFRVIFIILNVIYIILGLIGIALGIYSLVQIGTFSFITGNDIIGGAALLIIVGAAVVIIGGIGFVGAVFLWRPLLVIYAIIWIIILILEIVGAILGFIYSAAVSAETLRLYRNGIQNALDQFNTTQDSTRAVNIFQETLGCCGNDNASDWVNTTFFQNGNSLPSSCDCTSGTTNCGNVIVDGMTFQNVYTIGCLDRSIGFFQQVSLIAGICGIVFAIIEALGVVVAIGLVCCITAGKDKEVA